jgi:hypothetical protein
MIVHNPNLNGIGVNPAEADPPLVVDPNTILPHSVAAEGLPAKYYRSALNAMR